MIHTSDDFRAYSRLLAAELAGSRGLQVVENSSLTVATPDRTASSPTSNVITKWLFCPALALNALRAAV